MAALAVRAHMRQKHGDAVHDAHQIDAEHPLPLTLRQFGDFAGPAADAGIVADEMHAPERVDGPVRRVLQRSAVGRIAYETAQAIRIGAERVYRLGERRLLDVGQGDLHAFAQKASREFQAEAAAAARHERRLALEIAQRAASRFLVNNSPGRLRHFRTPNKSA